MTQKTVCLATKDHTNLLINFQAASITVTLVLDVCVMRMFCRIALVVPCKINFLQCTIVFFPGGGGDAYINFQW